MGQDNLYSHYKPHGSKWLSLISAVEGIEISTFDSPFGVGQKAAATTKFEMLWSDNGIAYSGDPSS